MKVCPHCHRHKTLTDFYQRKDGRVGSWCRECVGDKTREQQQAKPAHYLEYEQRKRLRRDFGLTLEQYNQMAAEQGHVCAICRQPETRLGRSGKVKLLAVDHDHQTGELRRLLCHRCNIGLGQFRDDPKLLQRAMDYLNDYPRRSK